MTDNVKNLATIRKEADELDVKYHHKANAKTIRAAINAHLVKAKDKSDEPIIDNIKVTTAPIYEPPMTQAEFDAGQARLAGKLAGSLVRVRIMNQNPSKKDWGGEIISVGSAKLGTFKKYIPFGSGEPYHIPRIIYDVLKDKKCSTFYNVDDGKGHKRRKSKLTNEYIIELLDPLTPKEMQELALKQSMAKGKEG